MTNVKAAVMGALVGLSGFFGGVSLAKADCDAGTYAAAVADAAEGNRRGDVCEVIELQNGTFEAQCDSEAHADESAACEAWVEGMTESGDWPVLTDDELGAQYEACMTLALHTGAVHQ